MMKTILYATDFSSNAEKAFIYAFVLAQKHEAELIMLHVCDIPVVWSSPYPVDVVAITREAKKAAEIKLKTLFDRYVKEDEKEVDVKFVVTEYPTPAQGVLEFINENKPDLVVTGSHGGGKAMEFLMGSTTKLLTRKSESPVLVIPQYPEARDFKEVVYASDFYEHDILAIQKLIDWIKPFDSRITVLHISTENEAKSEMKMEWFKELVREELPEANLNFELLHSDNVEGMLHLYMDQNEIGLLTMLEKERKGFLDSLFHRDLINKMEFLSTVPMLSFHEKYILEERGDKKELANENG